MEDLHLIVGLGNPGPQYIQTRHNAGFLVADLLARRWQVSWKKDEHFQAMLARARAGGTRAVLCQPLTYMNLSGEAVRALTDYYQIAQDKILVLVDDADLPLGTIRLRPQGGSAGHHGLESIERLLGTAQYARLRIGIGRASPSAREITGHVLGTFSAAERALFGQAAERAANQAECWLRRGIQSAMNEFNGTTEIAGTKDDE